MTRLNKLPLIALLTALLIACGAKEEPTGVISKGHLDALDKANNVENVLQDTQQRTREEIDNPG